MKSIKYVVMGIILITFFLYSARYLGNNKRERELYKEQVKNLSNEINKLQVEKDSLMLRIDSLYEVKNQIDTIYEKEIQIYEKTIDDILTQSASDDVLFFSRYLSKTFGE